MSQVFIAIGSNIHPHDNVRRALLLLHQRLPLAALSTVWRTAPIGAPGQAPYYNAVAMAHTDLAARDLKTRILRDIETQLGRRRSPDKYAPRPIDLDLLLYDALVTHAPDLDLPDPHITQRAFLATGIAELAPKLILPGSQQTITAVAASLPCDSMEPLSDYTRELRQALGLSSRIKNGPLGRNSGV